MKQLKSTKLTDTIELNKALIKTQLADVARVPNPQAALYVLLPLSALFLWSISLKYIDIRQMNDLGLISVFPYLTIIALIILMLSFCLTLRQLRVPIILLHLVLLIVMLYGVTALIEEAPRFSVVYRHAGYTEYIMRTGTVNPGLDAYFNWPGFFVLVAFVTRIAGYHDILAYAAWAPVFFNLLYLGPMYMIFAAATTDKRLVWLGLWFFYLTNWIGQDYFSPQGFDFFLYLVIIAILLRWFKAAPATRPLLGQQHWKRLGYFSRFAQGLHDWLVAPDALSTPSQPRQRIALLASMVAIFALIVFCHPLTPFFVIVSVTALVVFRRCKPVWLPVLMAAMTGAWIIFMTQSFLAGHLDWIAGSFGQISSTISSNVTSKVAGSPEHTFIIQIRFIMTVLIWVLAFVGGVQRLRKGYRDVTCVLLAIAPFPLLITQPYGGEMLLRIYLFSLPLMAFFVAANFHTTPVTRTSRWGTAAIAGASMILLAGFLFTRYGNERMDYMTNAEVNGVRYLYSVAQPNSIFIEGWDGTPWQFQDYEKYDTYSMTDALPDAVARGDVHAVVQFIEGVKHSNAYLIFTRSQKATADATSGMPPGTLDRLEDKLIASGKFTMVYSNSDAQIFMFIQGKKPAHL
jgi:hypothetical protein